MCHSEPVHGWEHTNQLIYLSINILKYNITKKSKMFELKRLNYDVVIGMALRKKMLEITTAGGLCYCGVRDVSLSPETDFMEGII